MNDEPLQPHILFFFIVLAMAKHIGIGTEMSIKVFLTEAKKLTEDQLLNKITNSIRLH